MIGTPATGSTARCVVQRWHWHKLPIHGIITIVLVGLEILCFHWFGMDNLSKGERRHMRGTEADQARRQRSFAVASLGKERWFWVVWPSIEQLESGEFGQDISWGYERTKAEAVNQALAVAGANGKQFPATYAKQYHKLKRSFEHEAPRRRHRSEASPAALEYVYRDKRDPLTHRWYSVRHRVVKKTKRYVYVEQRPYDASARTGTWLDHTDEVFRLNRRTLEREGYALAPVTADLDDPMFFVTPFHERVTRPDGHTPSCLARLGLSYPATLAQVKASYRHLAKRAHPDQGGDKEEFLALQVAYEQALRLCRD
jgi:hypothetical protein